VLLAADAAGSLLLSVVDTAGGTGTAEEGLLLGESEANPLRTGVLEVYPDLMKGPSGTDFDPTAVWATIETPVAVRHGPHVTRASCQGNEVLVVAYGGQDGQARASVLAGPGTWGPWCVLGDSQVMELALIAEKAAPKGSSDGSTTASPPAAAAAEAVPLADLVAAGGGDESMFQGIEVDEHGAVSSSAWGAFLAAESIKSLDEIESLVASMEISGGQPGSSSPRRGKGDLRDLLAEAREVHELIALQSSGGRRGSAAACDASLPLMYLVEALNGDETPFTGLKGDAQGRVGVPAWVEFLAEQHGRREAGALPGAGDDWLGGLLGKLRAAVSPEVQRERERTRLVAEASVMYARLAQARVQRQSLPPWGEGGESSGRSRVRPRLRIQDLLAAYTCGGGGDASQEGPQLPFQRLPLEAGDEVLPGAWTEFLVREAAERDFDQGPGAGNRCLRDTILVLQRGVGECTGPNAERHWLMAEVDRLYSMMEVDPVPVGMLRHAFLGDDSPFGASIDKATSLATGELYVKDGALTRASFVAYLTAQHAERDAAAAGAGGLLGRGNQWLRGVSLKLRAGISEEAQRQVELTGILKV